MRNSSLIGMLLLAVVLLTLPASGQSRKERDEAKKFRDQADKEIGARNYKQAAELYGRTVQLVPTDSYAHYRKGFAHYSLKEYDLAINSFSTALTQGYKAIDIYRIRYHVYFEQGKYDLALADVQKALAVTPNDLSLLSSAGEIHYLRKAYPEAKETFLKAAAVAPANNGDVYYSLARVAHAMNDAAAQATAAETALTRGTRFPGEAFFLLGDANQKLKKVPAAIDAFQKALGVKPKMYQIYQNLGELFKLESRYTEAIDILKKGLEQFPADGNFYTDLGLLYSLAGRHADAVEAAKSGVKLLPDQPAGYTNLCRAYNELKEFQRAIEACNTSLRIRPGDGETYFYLGNAYVLTNKPGDATRAYSNAVKGLVEVTAKNPEQSDLWYLLGNAYFADRQYDRAIESYVKCLSISPKFLNARANLGISYAKKKDKPAAMEQYNFLAGTNPSLAARVKAEIDRM